MFNWFKDKLFQQLEADFKRLKVDFEIIEKKIAGYEEQVRSLKGLIYRARREDVEIPSPKKQKTETEMTPEMQAFIAGLPEWERARLKNNNDDE